jgi:hypothetical protein
LGGYKGESQSGTRGVTPSEVEVRTPLEQMVEATNRLAAGLDAAGLNQQLRQSPAYTLRSLERGLPNCTVEDVLLACEAYAMVTAPSALATGDLIRVRDEALRTLQLLRALAGGIRARRRRTGMTTVLTAGSFLRSAFNEPAVQAALAALIEPLSALAFMDSTQQQKRRRLLPVGVGCFVPGTVLAGAFALIVFLLTSIAFAAGQIAISPTGIDVPVLSGGIHHTSGPAATPTPTVRANVPAPQPTGTPRAQPTAGASPTATTPAGSPTLSVSKSAVSPCPGASDAFTLTYSGGPSPITWTATPSDQTDIALNPTNGTLQPSGAGSTTNVTVTLVNDVTITGTITIATSNNLTRTIQYDSTGC